MHPFGVSSHVVKAIQGINVIAGLDLPAWEGMVGVMTATER
jgi:hypothetical protein